MYKGGFFLYCYVNSFEAIISLLFSSLLSLLLFDDLGEEVNGSGGELVVKDAEGL